MADSLQSPDDKRLFLLLRDTGLDSEKAYTFVQELRTMAAENIIARYESKLDAHTAYMGAKLDALTAKLDARTASLSAGMDARLDALTAKLDARTASLSAGMDARLDAQNASLDAQNVSLDAKIAIVGEQTSSMSTRMNVLMWVIGVAFALLVALNFLPATVL